MRDKGQTAFEAYSERGGFDGIRKWSFQSHAERERWASVEAACRGSAPSSVLSDLDAVARCLYTGQKSQVKHSAQLAFRRVLTWLNISSTSTHGDQSGLT